nr:MmcQ/YjbR family DNA-binding protein [Arsenicicoccus sp. oral taxon 190]
MYDEDDPMLARVRELALALPGADVKISHGRPAFFTTKVFAYYGGSRKVDGQWRQHPKSVVVQAAAGDREALRQLPGAYVPGYLGASGWTGLDLGEAPDWGEVAEILQDSYRATAPARLVAQLDEDDHADGHHPRHNHGHGHDAEQDHAPGR